MKFRLPELKDKEIIKSYYGNYDDFTTKHII